MERIAGVKRGLLFLILSVLVGAVALVLSGGQSRAALSAAAPMDGTEPLPAGASVQTVLSNMDAPVAMAFDPAGRLFYTEKATGRVRLYENGALQATPVITFTVDSNGERGLLGITIDPDFNTNHYIYVYYTCGAAGGCPTLQNQVVRFEEHSGVGSSPTVVFFSPQSATNHNGGNIHFGPDGKLFISIGDNGNAANSQDVNVKNGKMHRINGNGTIPPDNPVFTQTGALPSLFAMGLRNSFDFAFDPVTTKMFASENGPGCDDEMNRIEGAYNYGWRAAYPCDDPNPDLRYNTILPLWYLPNGLCCEAPTGVGFYEGSQVPQWHNELFMCAYNTGAFRHMYLDATRRTLTAVNVVQGVTCNTDIETGPDGALWYIEGGGYSPGTLKKIVGPGSGSPTATATATGTPTDTRTPTSTRTITPTRTATPTTPVPTATPCPMNFSDVQSTDWFYEYVQCLYCRGAISGYADGTFRPYNDTTRGQMTKIVVLGFGIPTVTPTTPTFTDVLPGSAFYEYVETAAAHDIISGYADGTFRPNNNVTRGQLSKITTIAGTEAFGWTLINPPTGTFSDVQPGSPFYTYIETAACHGIISGYADGTFRPGNNATRAQIAKIVCLAVRNPPPCLAP